MISIDDFSKIELKVGTVLEAEDVEGSEKLIKLMVDLGEEEPRQILAGVKQWYKPDGNGVSRHDAGSRHKKWSCFSDCPQKSSCRYQNPLNCVKISLTCSEWSRTMQAQRLPLE